MSVGGLLSLSVACRLCHFEHEKVYIQLVMVTGGNFSKRSTKSFTCFYPISFHKHGNIILKNSVLKQFLLQTSVKRSFRCILTEKCPMVKGYCKLAYAFLKEGSKFHFPAQILPKSQFFNWCHFSRWRNNSWLKAAHKWQKFIRLRRRKYHY